MSETKQTFWDKSTKMMVGAVATVLMAFGAKYVAERWLPDAQPDNIENVNKKNKIKEDVKKMPLTPRAMRRQLRREVQQKLQEMASERANAPVQKQIEAVKAKSDDLQQRKETVNSVAKSQVETAKEQNQTIRGDGQNLASRGSSSTYNY